LLVGSRSRASGNHFGGFGDRYLQPRAVEAGQNQATREKRDLVQGRDRPKFASITRYGNSNSENPVSISSMAHIENGHRSNSWVALLKKSRSCDL
jgi:hypothetical protein